MRKEEYIQVGFDIIFKITIKVNNTNKQYNYNEENIIEILNISSYNKDNKSKTIQKYIFNKSSTSVISIGKDVNKCNIIVDNSNIANIQTTIYWNNKLKKWIIKDGSKYSLSTTMLTWLFTKHSIEIRNGMIFKLFGSKIIIFKNSF